MRILFVTGNDFRTPSEKQAVWFSQELIRRGHEVMISVLGDPATARDEGVLDMGGLRVRGHAFRGRVLRRGDRAAGRAFGPDLIHSFSPRLGMVAAARDYARATDAPVLVHWEDDEWSLRDDPMRRPLPRRVARRVRSAVADALLPRYGWFATPRTLRWVAGHVAGHDALTPALARRVRERLGRPCSVVLPINPHVGAEAASRPPPRLPATLRGKDLLLFTGTVGPPGEIDLDIALRATAEVQRRGHDVAFVHAGVILRRYDAERYARRAGVAPGTAAFLGYLPFADIPPLLRIGSVLLQPGLPSDYNRFRLPAKLQAYLASGTPTVTFAVGFGELLADRHEVLKTHTGDPGELADRLVELLEDRELARRLSEGGRAAARRLFDSGRNGDALERHYRRTLGVSNEWRGGGRPHP